MDRWHQPASCLQYLRYQHVHRCQPGQGETSASTIGIRWIGGTNQQAASSTSGTSTPTGASPAWVRPAPAPLRSGASVDSRSMPAQQQVSSTLAHRYQPCPLSSTPWWCPMYCWRWMRQLILTSPRPLWHQPAYRHQHAHRRQSGQAEPSSTTIEIRWISGTNKDVDSTTTGTSSSTGASPARARTAPASCDQVNGWHRTQADLSTSSTVSHHGFSTPSASATPQRPGTPPTSRCQRSAGAGTHPPLSGASPAKVSPTPTPLSPAAWGAPTSKLPSAPPAPACPPVPARPK